ncbi:MAG TPA: hypothetical protein VHV51_09890 [Polyangiaceae bacterium]|jgi:hypothetical protein|nr:hypothetical protein [Polyangiaceae bacterium]
MKRSAVFVAGALGLAGSFFAGAAYAAADARLSEANDHVTQALVLLKAAADPDKKPPFGGHRDKAVALLTQAQGEIGKAIDFANAPPKPTKKPGK